MSRPEVLRHSPQELLSVRDIEVQFTKRTGLLGMRPETFTAVGGVSLSVARGETLGLVGESGSGKSTLARGILGLTPLTAGSVGFDGHDLHALSGRELRRVQQDIQMVFQDPLASLNPRYTIGQAIAEGWRIHPATAPPRGRRRQRVGELLELVGLNPDHAERYAHEFSGGQRQRVSIARAIAMDPKLIVCDEAVSALDVSIQAQVLNLLGDLQRELGIAYLFISHDLSVVRYIADRVAVMYRGELVETGDTEDIFTSPQHPYTARLLDAIPTVRPWAAEAAAGTSSEWSHS